MMLSAGEVSSISFDVVCVFALAYLVCLRITLSSIKKHYVSQKTVLFAYTQKVQSFILCRFLLIWDTQSHNQIPHAHHAKTHPLD